MKGAARSGTVLAALMLLGGFWPNSAAWPGGPAFGPGAAHGQPVSGGPGQSAQVMEEVLTRLKQEYLYRDKLDYRRMVVGALNRLSARYPEVIHSVYEIGGQLQLKLAVGKVKIAQKGLALDNLEQFYQALEQIQSFISYNLPGALPPDSLMMEMAEGALDGLDPYSRLMTPGDYEEFRIATSGQYGGVGLMVAQRQGKLLVDYVLVGSPADKEGLAPGDEITQINGQPAFLMSMEEARELLRGKVGSSLALNFKLPSGKERLVALRRKALSVDSVDAYLFEESPEKWTGYVRVRRFTDSTTQELLDKLEKLFLDKSGAQGLILDLRGNRGGVMNQAVRCADLFLDNGLIVKTVWGNGQVEEERARVYRAVTNTPLVVLIDGHTASAAEVLAGALKNNSRAVLLGSRSFGKGTVQSIYPLSNGYALKLTVASYLTPPDQSIHEKGIQPHLALARLRTQGAVQLLQNSLPSGEERPQLTLPYLDNRPPLPDGLPLPRAPHRRKALLEADYPLELARRALLLNERRDQANLLQSAHTLFQAEAARQEAALIQELAKSGIDWSPGPAEPAKLALVEAKLENRRAAAAKWQPVRGPVAAGSQARLVLKVAHLEGAPVNRLLALVENPAPGGGWLEIPLGRLEPRGQRQVETVLELPPHLEQGIHPLAFKLASPTHTLLEATLLLPVRAMAQPFYQVGVAFQDGLQQEAQGNGDGVAQPGETLGLAVTVKNRGDGPSGPGRVVVLQGGAPAAGQPGGRAYHPSIKPGQSQTSLLSLKLPLKSPPGQPPFQLEVADSGFTHQRLIHTLKVTPGRKLRKEAFAPPLLRLYQRPPMELFTPQITLSGQALDDTAIQAVVVAINGEKVFYLPGGKGGDQASLSFQMEGALQPGLNRVQVMALDNERLATQETFRVWRIRRDAADFPLVK